MRHALCFYRKGRRLYEHVGVRSEGTEGLVNLVGYRNKNTDLKFLSQITPSKSSSLLINDATGNLNIFILLVSFNWIRH